jgi:hypothetical protein
MLLAQPLDEDRARVEMQASGDLAVVAGRHHRYIVHGPSDALDHLQRVSGQLGQAVRCQG